MSTVDSEFNVTREMKARAGHQEILGETLAKFEFFQHGWHPYSRFLDVDKVDLLLRRRRGNQVEYREVQVKYGKLFTCTLKWELPLFDVTSWRFFTEKNLHDLTERGALFVAYVLAPDDGFKGDMFIMRSDHFVDLVRRSDKLGNGSYRVLISRSREETPRWLLRRGTKFAQLTDETVIDMTPHYRHFACLR